jgi:hypothetical protein
MKNFFKRLPEAVVRVGIVFLLFISTVAFARWMIPASLKNGREHRTATVKRESAKTVHYAGADACNECHKEINAVKTDGYHRNLSCETCHGASKDHSEDPDVKPLTEKARDACTRCHAYDPSRPTGFPQINPVVHNPRKQCVECHKPHSPKPPHVPQECEACHAQIARTKEVSPHDVLPCTTCHTVDVQHKVSPREVRAKIPSDRSFCAKCHSSDSQVKDTQKVDLKTHGEKYLCWQCHYPHMPELHTYGATPVR